MGYYKSNVRDLEFNLFEVLELEINALYGRPVGSRSCLLQRKSRRGQLFSQITSCPGDR